MAAAAATGTTTPDRANELTATAKTKDGSQGGQEMDKQNEHFYAKDRENAFSCSGWKVSSSRESMS